MPDDNRMFLLSERPSPRLGEATLTLARGEVPEPRRGQLLVQNLWLSVDPANRTWMNERATYLPPVKLGSVMRGITVSRVVRAEARGFEPGDLVSCMGGWAEYAAVDALGATTLPGGRDPRQALSVLGHTGLAAYFGLLEIGAPERGDTVLVSAAAGATGSVAGQIAVMRGCRVVGIAGGADKCAWLTGELGFAAAIDRRATEDMTHPIARACPDGVHVFFDNVGGRTLDAGLANLAMGARVVLCGAISQYEAPRVEGPRNYLALLVRRARMEGFLVTDFLDRADEATDALEAWMAAGKLRYRLDVVEGLERAPAALRALFEGTNRGKVLVHIAD